MSNRPGQRAGNYYRNKEVQHPWQIRTDFVRSILFWSLLAVSLSMGNQVMAGGSSASGPRILPIDEQDLPERVKQLKNTNPRIARLNIIRTMARHPELHKAWSKFAGYIIRNSTLPDRDRELATLRIGWLCKAEYEWSQHTVMAKAVGVTEAEIEQVILGAEGNWNEFDKALMTAVDELHSSSSITDVTWRRLSSHYSEHQMMDFVFTVGQYTLVSMALNSFGVEIDEGYSGFPESSKDEPGLTAN
ncbi:MAG: carboxymuconolactone decarboxylase [Gammaproteobacteria bacterium]|jgi:alkylhydroperoxidase family enzyme|nr:carboxymuconolactone decarboxylase [Gammaproteobacteria bacterium]|tara:strand:+ start:264 stop:1001 length:738 start_codon:yes stop_codon:yes gene_type:complete